MNTTSLDTLCAALCYAAGVDAPAQAAEANPALCTYLDAQNAAGKCDRIFMYNPDAVAHWISDKYPDFIAEVKKLAPQALPLKAVMPSVTPVCFGTMYTGAQPEVHGIRSYTKPVITIDTIFDAMLRAGKKCAIVCTDGDSLSRIYNERDMDYFYYPTLDEVNAKAAELILEDKHDLIVVYHGNYDSVMHKHGPESLEALAELRANAEAFAAFSAMIDAHWGGHNTLVGFAMDHGCHEIDDDLGSHGLDMPEDLNILHFYKAKIGADAV